MLLTLRLACLFLAPSLVSGQTEIQAFVDGASELHVTTRGLYWKHVSYSKPGRNDGRREPTRINNTAWQPKWPDDDDSSAGASDVFPVAMPTLDLEIRPGPGNRNPVTTRREAGEFVVIFDDPQNGASWYTITLVPAAQKSADGGVLADTAQSMTPAGRTTDIRLGDYTLKIPPGWKRGPLAEENRRGVWIWVYAGSLLDGTAATAGEVSIELSQTGDPYQGEKELSDGFATMRKFMRAGSAGDTARFDTYRVAGAEAFRAREQRATSINYTMRAYNAQKTYDIILRAPPGRPDWPREADAFFAGLSLAGPPFRSAGTSAVDLALGGRARTVHPTQSIVDQMPVLARPAADEAYTSPRRNDLQLDAAACRLTLAPPRPRRALTADSYTEGVTMAMQGMRLIQGELAPDQERRFQAKWAKLLQFPTEASIAYFDKLVPLMEQFLAMRLLTQEAARDFDKLWEEAVAAMAAEDPEGANAAMAAADAQRRVLVCAHAELAAIVKKVEELGNPPDPVAARQRARELTGRPQQASGTVSSAGEAPELEGVWVGTCEYEDGETSPCSMAFSAAESLGRGRYAVRLRHESSNPSLRTNRRSGGSITIEKAGAGELAGVYSVARPDLDPDLRVAAARLGSVGVRLEGDRLEYRRQGGLPAAGPSRYLAPATAHLQRAGSQSPPHYYPFDEVEALSMGSPAKNIMQQQNADRRALYLSYCGGFAYRQTSDLVTAEMLVGPRYTELRAAFQPCPGRVTAPAAPVAAPVTDAAAERKRIAETIAEKQSWLVIMEKNLAADRAELARAADEKTRAQLYLRVLDGEANIQAEKDLIQSLETGQYVHTRTARDDYQRDLMISQSLDYVARVEEARRIAAALPRLAATASDPAQAQQLREFVQRTVTPADIAAGNVEKLRQAAQAVGKVAQGSSEGEAARQMERAIDAQQAEHYLQVTKAGAGMVLMALGPQAFAAAGFAPAAAGTLTSVSAISFGAATGAVEGGPVEAFKQGAMMSSVGVYAAADALLTAQKDGFWAGVERGASVYLLGKTIEIGAAKAGGLLARAHGASSGAAPKLSNMTAEEFAITKEVKSSFAAGGRLLDEYKMVAAEFRAAARPGVAPEALAAAEQKLLAKAAEINSNVAGKLLVKKGARTPEGAALQRDLAESIDRLYATRVDRPFLRAVEKSGLKWEQRTAAGWRPAGTLSFKEIRNASSKGTLNMDRDLALVEKDFTQFRIVDASGKPVQLHEAQEQLQKMYEGAYQAATGRDARSAFQTITTSAHEEAYKQMAFTRIGKPESIEAIRNGGWTGQAADVGRIKVWKTPDPNLAEPLRRIENARAAAKEIDKRLAPLLKAQQADPAKIKHWESVRDALNYMTENPVAGARLLRMRTGYDRVEDVIDVIGTAIEGSVKLGR